jgi:hypothetical protein
MGVYVFNADYLYEALKADAVAQSSSRDFGKDLIPAIVARCEAVAHPFGLSCVKSSPEAPAYWRDVGTIDAYWSANLDLTSITPDLDMYDRQWPIWTHQEQLPPAKFVFDDEGRRGMVVDSLVSGGCIISGAYARRSVLFSKVRLHSYCHVEEAVLLPEVDVGRHCRLRKVVIDKGCQHSGRNVDRIRCGRRCAPLFPHRTGRRAGDPRDAGAPGNGGKTCKGPWVNILYVCTEVYPLLKTGGLADVSAALSAALRDLGCDVRLLLPGFAPIAAGFVADGPPLKLSATGGPEIVRTLKPAPTLLPGRLATTGQPAYLLDAPALYHRDGGPYLDAQGNEWPDNAQRFALLAWAAAGLGCGGDPSWRPDVVHAHDWHAGLAPLYLQQLAGSGPGRPLCSLCTTWLTRVCLARTRWRPWAWRPRCSASTASSPTATSRS